MRICVWIRCVLSKGTRCNDRLESSLELGVEYKRLEESLMYSVGSRVSVKMQSRRMDKFEVLIFVLASY